jgi:hypothetical protein
LNYHWSNELESTVFHSVTSQYTFFSASYGIFSKIDHILGHKQVLTNRKETEIMPWILLNHNITKPEFNNKRKSRNNLETEQHIAPWSVGHGRNREEIKKISWI